MDPTGLVKWTGEMYSSAFVPGFGGGMFWFDLKSECINGKYAYIQVSAKAFGAGFGVKLSGGGSQISFDDLNSEINPNGFEGVFRLIGANMGALLVGGWTSVQLGQNISDVSGAPSAGIGVDASIGGFRGTSKLKNVTIKPCNACSS